MTTKKNIVKPKKADYKIKDKKITLNTFIKKVFEEGMGTGYFTYGNKSGTVEDYIQFIKKNNFGQTPEEKEKLIKAYKEYSIVGYKVDDIKIIKGFIVGDYLRLTIKINSHVNVVEKEILIPKNLPIQEIRHTAIQFARQEYNDIYNIRKELRGYTSTSIQEVNDKLNTAIKKFKNDISINLIMGSISLIGLAILSGLFMYKFW